MSNGDTKRLELIGSITASIIVVIFSVSIVLTIATSATFSGIPSIIMLLYSFVVSLAIIQVVGTDVLKAYKSYKDEESDE